MTKTTKNDLDESFREYAWNYFELHAKQRLKTFQFFITLATALIGGILLLIPDAQSYKWMAVLGFLLCFFSFVFWKLDKRTSALIQNAEEALKFLDTRHNLPNIDGAPHPLRMFTRDDHFISQAKKFPLMDGHFSYSRSFKYVFIAFSVIGASVGIVSFCYMAV